ncbi:MAG: hypothetical protein JXR68_09870 [Bacteroidales bacterium]|nr:hypothetical protein [Bacteroidales bacterium]
MLNLKTELKKINLNELLFDGFIILSFMVMKFFLQNSTILDISDTKNHEVLSVLLLIFPAFIYLYLGKITSSFIKNKSGILLILFSFITAIVITLSIEFTLGKHYEILFDDFSIIYLFLTIPAFIFGLISHYKGFKKAVIISGIVVILLLVAIAVVFMLSEDLFTVGLNIIILGVAIILGVFILIFTPIFLIKIIKKNSKVKKQIINLITFLTGLSFAFWYFISEKLLISQSALGVIKSSNFGYYFLAIFLFRILIAIEPPKNKLNMIIGAIVVIISLLI